MSELQQPKRREYRRKGAGAQADSWRRFRAGFRGCFAPPAPRAIAGDAHPRRVARWRRAKSGSESGPGRRERTLDDSKTGGGDAELARRRARLWDKVVGGQRALLPPEAPDFLWEPERDEERIATLERLVPGTLERISTCLRLLGAASPEWHVNLPLDRLLEPWLHEAFSGEVVAAAVDRVLGEPLGLAGSARWLLHARGAAHVPSHDAVRLVPVVARWSLAHPVPRNRTETLEVLADIQSAFVLPLLHEVLAAGFEPRALEPEWSDLVALFGPAETFFAFDTHLLRGTGDRAFAALLLARRGETGIRPRVREMMDSAGTAHFHALALALEALEENGGKDRE